MCSGEYFAFLYHYFVVLLTSVQAPEYQHLVVAEVIAIYGYGCFSVLYLPSSYEILISSSYASFVYLSLIFFVAFMCNLFLLVISCNRVSSLSYHIFTLNPLDCLGNKWKSQMDCVWWPCRCSVDWKYEHSPWWQQNALLGKQRTYQAE